MSDKWRTGDENDVCENRRGVWRVGQQEDMAPEEGDVKVAEHVRTELAKSVFDDIVDSNRVAQHAVDEAKADGEDVGKDKRLVREKHGADGNCQCAKHVQQSRCPGILAAHMIANQTST